MSPLLGEIVLFVLPNGKRRPAIVVNVFSEEVINLQVFVDSDSQARFNDKLPQVVWETSVIYDKTGEIPGTWSYRHDAL